MQLPFKMPLWIFSPCIIPWDEPPFDTMYPTIYNAVIIPFLSYVYWIDDSLLGIDIIVSKYSLTLLTAWLSVKLHAGCISLSHCKLFRNAIEIAIFFIQLPFKIRWCAYFVWNFPGTMAFLFVMTTIHVSAQVLGGIHYFIMSPFRCLMALRKMAASILWH